MKHKEFEIIRITDTLNPPPPKFGMPWYVILFILAICALMLMIPGCRLIAFILAPSILCFGWWIVKDDPQEWKLLWYDLLLPSAGYDPGK